MFGPKLTTVFASRWRALWFAAATLSTAYCATPHEQDGNEVASVAEAQQVIDASGLSEAERKQAEATLKQIEALTK